MKIRKFNENKEELNIDSIIRFCKEYNINDIDEFGRKCFYEGREIYEVDEHGSPIFSFPTYNGYLRYLNGDEHEKRKI